MKCRIPGSGALPETRNRLDRPQPAPVKDGNPISERFGDLNDLRSEDDTMSSAGGSSGLMTKNPQFDRTSIQGDTRSVAFGGFF
ncbi:MAG: hypothetical protein JNN07_10210 [Verrucomicrobiales bacterium]|nr:hypothetical protein [Verrucomicrobiales bacterium]